MSLQIPLQIRNRLKLSATSHTIQLPVSRLRDNPARLQLPKLPPQRTNPTHPRLLLGNLRMARPSSASRTLAATHTLLFPNCLRSGPAYTFLRQRRDDLLMNQLPNFLSSYRSLNIVHSFRVNPHSILTNLQYLRCQTPLIGKISHCFSAPFSLFAFFCALFGRSDFLAGDFGSFLETFASSATLRFGFSSFATGFF